MADFSVEDILMENKLWTKDFTIITLGSVVSMIGNALASFAMSLFVLDFTGSTLYYSIYIFLYTLPQIAAPVISGPLMDRFSRRSTGTTALAEAKTELEEANKKYKDMLGKYNKLIEKYNDLVNRYNNAMKLLKSGTVKLNPKELENLDDEMIAQILNAAEERDRAIDRYGSFGRAWNTFFCFPCNFIRSGFAAHNIYSAFDNKVCGFFTAAISTPVVFCCEVVPAVCDFGNGLVDMLSAGTYGDWLYSGDLTSQWYKRDDTHFPWLDREK